jgi:micrococcal nuclease
VGEDLSIKAGFIMLDKYGRTLAYVYLEDGTFLNAEVVKQGEYFIKK